VYVGHNTKYCVSQRIIARALHRALVRSVQCVSKKVFWYLLRLFIPTQPYGHSVLQNSHSLGLTK